MDEQVIIPDLDATTDVNLVKLVLQDTKFRAEFTLNGLLQQKPKKGEKKEYDAEVKRCREALEAATKALEEFEPKPDQPSVTIGYIHPVKMDSLESQRYAAIRGGVDIEKMPPEQMDALKALHREFVQWGVKNHEIKNLPFAHEHKQLAGKQHLVVADELLDIYHSMKILGTRVLRILSDRVRQFNELSEKKKELSSSPSGTDPTTSTAEYVSTTKSKG